MPRTIRAHALAPQDVQWFRRHPGEAFRLRDPLPDEFSAEELAQPDRGRPVCFVLRRAVLLRHRLPPNPKVVQR